jgi:hypothetical protein
MFCACAGGAIASAAASPTAALSAARSVLRLIGFLLGEPASLADVPFFVLCPG